ncbi:MAG: AmmeMemoRadiSam system radical SAM enzyme [Candidatus Omnitrophica bacterium]|nr:AmmeMemoRadiSam system radical SAM enzyme [Candidatus Omnitrophota bacterium]
MNRRKLLKLIFIISLIYYSTTNNAISIEKQVEEKALFWERLKSNFVQCKLCPRYCIILPGKRGYCRVRENQNGELFALSYGKPVALHVDPIEKKPFFHFFPGTTVLSLATAGCNLHCKFCQNWQISQSSVEELDYQKLTAEEIIRQAKSVHTPSIAFTYTEPTVFFEYMLEIAKKAKEKGFYTCMHSNGYINPEPLRQLAKYLDAANIDLKGFSEQYYSKICEGSLAPVLASLKILKEEGVHLEITNLLISGYNDDRKTLRKMCLWIKEQLGEDTPLHFSRAYPMYKLPGIVPTPVELLEEAQRIAYECGLKYVYIGNVPGHFGEHTVCPECKKIIIKRIGYTIKEMHIKDGRCAFCRCTIHGRWE